MDTSVSLSDQLVTARELAAVLGIGARRVHQLAEATVFPMVGRSQYPLGRCVQAYIESCKAKERPAGELNARARIENARADKLELHNARLRGILRDVATVERAIEEWTRTERANLLALPAQFADTMAAELGVDVGLVLRVLQAMIRQHLARESERAFTLAERLEGAA